MGYHYKNIEHQEGLPLRLVLHRKANYSYHWHKELQFFLVLEGAILVKTTKQQYLVQKHEMLIMNCNEIHTSEFAGHNNLVLILQLDLTFCNSYGYDFTNIFFDREDDAYPDQQSESIRKLKKWIIDIVLEIHEKKIGFQNMAMSKVHQLISYLLRHFPYVLRDETAEAMSESDFKRLNRILNYINENYMHPISLVDIAEDEFLNHYYLTHFFKRKIGITFTQCLNQVRLQKATELLLSDPSVTMIDIAHTVGFSNVKSFTVNFRKKFNETPYRYRKRLLNHDEKGDNDRRVKTTLHKADDECYYPYIIHNLEKLLSSIA